MAAALPIETRNMIQSLVLQGLQNKAIADKLGVNQKTVATMKYRHRWGDTVATIAHKLGVASDQCISSDVATASAKTRTSLSRIVQETSESLESIKTAKRGLGGLKAKADVASTLATTADRIFGWSQSAEDTIVSVSVLRELAEPGALDIKPCQTLSDNPAVIPDTIDVDVAPAPSDTPATSDPATDRPVSGE